MEGCPTVMDAYIPRIGDRELVSRLESAGAVLIEPPVPAATAGEFLEPD